MDLLQTIGGYLFTDIRMAAPVLLAGLGLLLMNWSGLLNIGAEGIMLISALAAVVGSHFFGSVWMGLLLAMLAGAVFGLIFAVLTVTLRANQTVVGAALNILGLSLSTTLNRVFFGIETTVTKVDAFQVWEIPLLSKIPLIGRAFFAQMPIVYIAFLLVPLIHYFLFKTKPGLNLRSVGENPRVADTLGINVYRTQYLATIVGSMIIAAGGAFLSTGLLNFFAEDMVAGRGYIALAAVIFGKYRPTGIMFAAMIFMAGNVVSNVLQVAGVGIPYTFLTMIPYILTIIALTIFASRAVAPASLGRPYKRG